MVEFTIEFTTIDDEYMSLEMYFNCMKRYSRSRVNHRVKSLYAYHGTDSALDPILMYLCYYCGKAIPCVGIRDLYDPNDIHSTYMLTGGMKVIYARIFKYKITSLEYWINVVLRAVDVNINKFYHDLILNMVGMPHLAYLHRVIKGPHEDNPYRKLIKYVTKLNEESRKNEQTNGE